MNFYDLYKKKYSNIEKKFEDVTNADILKVLEKDLINEDDFFVLLSPRASEFLEPIAEKANKITLRNFGKVIQLYAPLYISNFCDNECLYCGFKGSNNITRKKLSLDEVAKEAEIISKTGIQHVLVLTGESRKESPVEYIKQCVNVLKNYFSSISIEIYPIEEQEYLELIKEGVDGLTVYQETYDEELYTKLHLKGLKRDYRFRLDTPERACRAGINNVSIGVLLGLSNFRKDVFLTGVHGFYLQRYYPNTEISISFPRIQPHKGVFIPRNLVNDKDLVQIILATRIFMPRAGINISTRENNNLRKNLIGLGVTRMSAGSKTEVGGYTLPLKSIGQFDVSDTASVDDVKKMIYSKGYQPVMKDWYIL